MIADHRSSWTGGRLLLLLLLLLGSLRLVFPGDVPFVNDEALLVENALDLNAEGRIATAGLTGTRGADYGPAPTWFYQLALSTTRDLRAVAVLKIVLVTGLTAWGLWLLAGAGLGLAPALGAFAFLSPYLWFYARDLWDNSFTIPFAAVLLGAYAAFLRSGRARYLAVAGLGGTLCLLTHLMTLPLVAAVGLHFVFARWRWVVASRRHLAAAVAVAAGCLLVALPYVLAGSETVTAPFRPFAMPRVGPILFALNGPRLFGPAGFEYFVGEWDPRAMTWGLRAVSLLSYAVVAYGLFLCGRAARAGEVERHGLDTVLVGALILFVFMSNSTRLSEHPHYYSGMWIVFFALWWIGMTDLLAAAWARWLLGAQAAVMAAFLVGMGAWLHVNGGTRSLHYGPTLSNQIEVARELQRLGVEGSPPATAIGPRLFPHAIGVLRRIDSEGGSGEVDPVRRPPSGYVVEYADPDGSGGRIALGRSPAAEGAPAR